MSSQLLCAREYLYNILESLLGEACYTLSATQHVCIAPGTDRKSGCRVDLHTELRRRGDPLTYLLTRLIQD